MYIGTARTKKIQTDVGPELRCPKCGRLLAEGRVVEIKLRCRKCGHWVYICEQTVDNCPEDLLSIV